MKLAAVADVHANHHALEAVMAAIEAAGVDLVVWLGDLVGYNAEPGKCVARIREEPSNVVIAGNHDRNTVSQKPHWGTNAVACQAQKWTRAQLTADELAYLAALPALAVDKRGFVAAHGCYLNDTHVNGYVTSTMLEANLEVIASKNGWPTVAFCGHTHTPLCGWLEKDSVKEDRLENPLHWPASATAVLINPGSVGQPRDGDPRASFAVVDLDARRIDVKRVPYDIEGAARAIIAAELPPSLAERLSEGR